MAIEFTKLIYEEYIGDSNVSTDAPAIILPNIQNLSISSSETVPTKKTISGDYRQQYAQRNPPKVSFSLRLTDDLDVEGYLGISGLIEKLNYLKENRIRFSLITVNADVLNNKYLDDLIIKSLNFDRSSELRGVIQCNLTCIKSQVAKIGWELIDLLQMFGAELESTSEETNEIRLQFLLYADTQDYFGYGWSAKRLLATMNSRFRSSLFADLGALFKMKTGLDIPKFHFELPAPIDLKTENTIYRCKAPWVSTKPIVSTKGNASSYDAILADIEINVEQTEVKPIYLAEYPYSDTDIFNFLDTYRRKPYTIEAYPPAGNVLLESIISAESSDKLQESDKTPNELINIDNFIWTKDARIGPRIGKVPWVYNFGNKQNYNLKNVDQYSFEKETLGPDRKFPQGITYDLFEVNNQIPLFKEDFIKDFWTDNREYTMYVMPVTVGTFLQIYLFSPSILFREGEIEAASISNRSDQSG